MGSRDKYKIIYVDRGVSNSFDNIILLHKNLRLDKWKALHDHCIEHETHHVVNKHYFSHALIDRWMPLRMWWQMQKFMFENPSALWQISPIRVIDIPELDETSIGWDLSAAIWLIMTTIFVLFLYTALGGVL